jgi:hypothetical protein
MRFIESVYCEEARHILQKQTNSTNRFLVTVGLGTSPRIPITKQHVHVVLVA